MKHISKSVLTIATLIALGAAKASTTITPGAAYGGLSFTGTMTLTFSEEALNEFMIERISVFGFGAAFADADNSAYVHASFTAPITALNFDGSHMTGVDGSGGASLMGRSTSALVLSDLHLDLSSLIVSGTLVGANGVGTRPGVAIWSIEGKPSYDPNGTFVAYSPGTSIEGPTWFPDAGGYTPRLNGLKFTDQALGLFAQSLNLKGFSAINLSRIADFGTIQLNVRAINAPLDTIVPDSPAVPEPSTMIMAAVAVSGMALTARRRKTS